MSDAKAVEQFVLAHNGGVLLPISVPKVCDLLLAWSHMVEAEDPYVPSEWRCPACNYRLGVEQACPVDGSKMVRVTWKEACLTASRIASRARKRCEILIEAWPDGFALPVGDEAEDKSIEEKIERLQEKGLYDILFRNAGVGLMFFNPPEGVTIETFRMVGRDIGDGRMVEVPVADNSWKKYLVVDTYYPSLDEAVSSEYLKRKGE